MQNTVITVSHREIPAGNSTDLSAQIPARKTYHVDKSIKISVWKREDEFFGNAQNESCSDTSILTKLA